jgi:hypothetical protein
MGLSRSGYNREPTHWSVRDAELIAALAKLVEGKRSIDRVLPGLG